MSRLLIASDAWHPQINGVVRTLERLARHLPEFGIEPVMLTPDGFATVPCPTYPEIRLTVAWPGSIGRRLDAIDPDHVHIATEGPIGFAVRRWCLRNRRLFTTSYHTRFPEYLAARLPIPVGWSYAMLRAFHNAGAGCMVSTRSIEIELQERGFRNLMRWMPISSGRAAIRTRSTCRGRSISMSAASRSRRISAPSSIARCPAARWWWATVRSSRRCGVRIPK